MARTTIKQTIEKLLNWGDGSGEELYDYLTNEGELENGEAILIISLLSKAVNN